MQTRRRELFTTIRTEGAILPPDLLQRISEGDRELHGLTPADYHLAAHERLGEAINRSWNRLVGAWAGFTEARERLPAGELGTSLTRERWLLILFQELGYGRLQTARAIELEGKSYAVSHGWTAVPIHLVGLGVPLDRRTPGVAGAAGQSPHGLLQELLNRDDNRLWGFVSNGLVLRVLRDNSSLTRHAYVEFDLEAMMDGEVYSDFVVLWLLCHQSRVESERPEEYWLERWSRTAAEQGTRALESLRSGVEEAISALGRGFLADPANGSLRDSLRSGSLTTQDYYRELLRLVYRLLFLFVAEDRDLLLLPDADPAARARYQRFYSTQRLRRLAERRRGGKHADLYQALRLVVAKLGDDEGCRGLGLPALGSFLWSETAIPHLSETELGNADLLAAVRALAFLEERGVRRAVDYKNLGSEEFGSVYESLLELHPELNVDAGTFELRVAAGHERKTTGSYYTPSSLINVLLDSALDPVLDEAAAAADPEAAIFDLKVCDPACGSGHFLVAAAHRIAKRLASVRTGDDEPSPEATRRALRDVVGRCLYGVDVNPVSVELCKVALWMEALEPGRPLSFLDAHIRCGNSLLGATPELLADGVPDEAFKPIEGDDREVVTQLRKRNRQEREGQLTVEDEVAELASKLTKDAAAIEAASDESIASVHAKEKRFRQLVASSEYERAKLLADAWCAGFVVEKTTGAPQITQGILRRIGRNADVDDVVIETIRKEEDEYRFFHWHVEFPAVFADGGGGFSCVLSNPPWEKVKLQEKEFFAGRHPEIATARTKAQRTQLIERLREEDAPLYVDFKRALRHADGESHLLRDSGRFPLAGRGDVNTYSVFAELMRSLISDRGRVGCILPLGIATDDTTKHFFGDLVARRSLASLYGFENEEFIFPSVDHRVTFGLLTMTGGGRPAREAEFAFFLRRTSSLADTDRRFTLTPDDFALLNPNTRTCPIFRSARDAELTKAIYRAVPVFIDEAQATNAWDATLAEVIHMSNDSHLFRERGDLEADGWVLDGNTFNRNDKKQLPLYEAKMLHHFDSRFGTYEGQTPEQAAQGKLPEFSDTDHGDPERFTLPLYWLSESDAEAIFSRHGTQRWLIGWRKIVRNTDERTFIAFAFPRVPLANSAITAFVTAEPRDGLIANLSSFCFDYVVRQKLAGTNMNHFVTKQLPVLRPEAYAQVAPWAAMALSEWVRPRVLELTYTAKDLEGFARDLGWHGAPFTWRAERRVLLRAELDAAYFHLYGLERTDVDYVMDSFWVVRDRDERRLGEYRTKRLILERYDAMAEAVATGRPYETALDPPPADPRVAHPSRAEEASEAAVVVALPFRRVEEAPEEQRYRSLAPIYSLKAAAGAFGRGEAVDPDGWAQLNGGPTLRPGMFVAQVSGQSMEPRIRDGSWCLFASPVEGSRDGKVVLAEHRAIADPETGGSYTVKRYRSKKVGGEDELWQHEEIVLEPLNPGYEPIVLRPDDDGDVRVIAEVVDVLS